MHRPYIFIRLIKVHSAQYIYITDSMKRASKL